MPFLSCYVFLTAQLSEGYDFVQPLTTFEVSSGMIYTGLLFLVLLASVITSWGRIFEGPNGEMVKADGTIVKRPYSIFMR